MPVEAMKAGAADYINKEDNGPPYPCDQRELIEGRQHNETETCRRSA